MKSELIIDLMLGLGLPLLLGTNGFNIYMIIQYRSDWITLTFLILLQLYGLFVLSLCIRIIILRLKSKRGM